MARTTAYEDGSGPELLTEIEELREEVEGLRVELREHDRARIALAQRLNAIVDGLVRGSPTGSPGRTFRRTEEPRP